MHDRKRFTLAEQVATHLKRELTAEEGKLLALAESVFKDSNELPKEKEKAMSA